MGTWAVKAVVAAVAGSVLALVGLTVVVPRFTSSVALTVMTGSMRPTLPVGSVVLVKPVDVGDVRAGDIITFQRRPGSTELTSHRVVEVHEGPDGPSFTTKGDANRGADLDVVPAQAVRGKVWFHVRGVGAWSDRVRTPLGYALLILLPAGWYAAGEVRARRRSDREDGDAAADVVFSAGAVPRILVAIEGSDRDDLVLTAPDPATTELLVGDHGAELVVTHRVVVSLPPKPRTRRKPPVPTEPVLVGATAGGES